MTISPTGRKKTDRKPLADLIASARQNQTDPYCASLHYRASAAKPRTIGYTDLRHMVGCAGDGQ